MNRGDIVLVRQPKTPAGKARPCLIVQHDATVGASEKIIVCPLTSQLGGAVGQRPVIIRSAENGLIATSEVQADWIFAAERSRVGRVIGHADEASMRAVDTALRRWLDL